MIEAESQAVLITLTEHNFQDAFRTWRKGTMKWICMWKSQPQIIRTTETRTPQTAILYRERPDLEEQLNEQNPPFLHLSRKRHETKGTRCGPFYK
jgi:hypothetical protein